VIMRAYCVDKIRRIEERAIAVEGVDALMQRAAAAVAARHPTAPRDERGRYRRRVMMVSAGNNGSDALFLAYGWLGAAPRHSNPLPGHPHSAAWRHCSAEVASRRPR
jgi:NAD(P)H-hydrate repair Nnr-like enzyme with NAD(P)H-hydrate epimerase domain